MSLPRVLWLLPLLVFAGCRSSQKSPSTAPRAVSSRFVSPKDDLNREVALKSPATRVVVIGPGAIETVFALGAQKSLIGRDGYADFPPAAKKVAVAGNYSGPGVEKCIALRPDLIIVQGETWDKARVESWQTQIGAPVAALTATNLAGVQRDFKKIGAWLGRPAQAKKLAQSLDIASPRIPQKMKAFFEVGRSPLYSAGKNTLIDDVMRAGGLENIASDVKGYQPFGIETLIARAPDVYISTSKSSRADVLRDLRAEPALSKLKCVRDGKVVVVQGDLLLRPGPRLRLGILELQRFSKTKSRDFHFDSPGKI
ncbi:ABC transporter substrate-binding protein [Abditibacterium utsteinense]|nr:ABC transporter substrate-binding protein [Abditibacterium utsteinense]